MDTSPANGNTRVGDLLIARGVLNQTDLAHAKQVWEEGQPGFGRLLIRLGLVSDRDLALTFSQEMDLPLLEEGDFPAVPVGDDTLSLKFLQEAAVVPFDEDEEHLYLAMAEPDDVFTIQAVEMATSKTVVPRVTTLGQVERVLDRLYGEGQSALAHIAEEIEGNDESSGADTIERLKDLAGEAPIVRLVNLIINRAIEQRASDIHIEPFENRLKVRYRIDGVLKEAEEPPARSAAAVISRIKIMAKLNIAERRLPQDGRIQLHAHGKKIDLRVSTVPTLYGESLVLRILDKGHTVVDLNTLGFTGDAEKSFNKVLSLSHGIVLVTGPTGSGKTTTLYAALQKLNTPEKKILTVEDPVEYQLEGVNQIQVKPQIGLHFADALRSIVRQDPDIIMIGEMRDLETARIAVQSALTGHLVFSTLHTNDAGSSITRLLDMGVEDYMLTSTLNGILAQRLVRTLCPCCRAYEPLPELVEELNLKAYTGTDKITLYKTSGCEQCAGTGYLGRTVVIEFLVLSAPIRRLILTHADGTQIQQVAIETGMGTMKVDGIRKALRGITTIEEVMRVTQE